MKISRPSKTHIVISICIIGTILFYFAFAKISVDSIIAKNTNGESVVSMGPGWIGALNFFLDEEPSLMDDNVYKYKISVIEYRSSTGKTLSRYEPTFAPLNTAKAYWTDKFVLISSKLNGECPDFRVFDRVTGAELEASSGHLSSLPSNLQLEYDPCVTGSDEYEEWLKKNPPSV